jgi:hypothetical protein
MCKKINKKLDHMKKILIIGLLISLALSSFSQAYIIKGFVKDAASLSPIKDVNISIYGTHKGTTTDESGFFYLEISNPNQKIIFSHLGYHNFEIKSSLILKNNDIYLESKITELHEVTIISDPIMNITKDLPIYIIDYSFVNNNICLLAYNKKKTNDIRLYLIDRDAKILNEMKIEKAESLFKDCFGDIYYINHDEAIKLSITENKIIKEKIIPRKEFELSYKAIEFKIEDNIYFSTNHYQNLVKKYHYINLYDEDREIHTFLNISDSNKIEEFEREFNFFYYAKKASKIGLSITSIYNNLGNFRENQALDWEDRIGRFSPVKIAVKSLQDSIYVFNYIRDNIEVYDISGILKRKASTKIFKDLNFTGQIIVSEENYKVYGIYKFGSIIQLREIDINTGNCLSTYKIPSYPFIENIKLIGNQVYFLFKKKVNQEYKQLYRMEL